MPKVKRVRRTKRGKRRVRFGPPPLRGTPRGTQMGPQVGGNFLFKLLGTVAKTLDALT